MSFQWFVYGAAISDILLFSISLYVVSRELGWKRRWLAWVPGVRFYCLSESVGMSKEGVSCGIIDFLFYVATALRFMPIPDNLGIMVAMIHLIVYIFLFIYRIQIFLQVLRVFELKKPWIIFFILIDWLPILVLGLSDKLEPNKELIAEDTHRRAPDQARSHDSSFDTSTLSNEGLSMYLEKRTVTDFGRKRNLLQDIRLDIPNKSLVLLLGGSGAGKTTLINAMIGYEKADATVLLNGDNVYDGKQSIHHKIGFVPQQNLIRGKDSVIRTVRDAASLRLPTYIHGRKRRERLNEVLDLLGLSAGKNGLVSKKSGGQLRRICIAMELVSDPELFVLDEPDSGLDGGISREIFTKLRQIADEGRIVLVITHTPDRVIDLFDKVIILARDSKRVGRLAFYGSPDEALRFFEKGSMEEIVMCINSEDEGGEGRADEFIEKYAAYAASVKEAADHE